MATTEPRHTESRDERIAELLHTRRPLTFQELLGREPQPGDAEDLAAFLDYLHSRHEQVRFLGVSE